MSPGRIKIYKKTSLVITLQDIDLIDQIYSLIVVLNTQQVTCSFTRHPAGGIGSLISVFVVDGDDCVDLDGDESDERREARLDGQRREGREAEHWHQGVQDQTLWKKQTI